MDQEPKIPSPASLARQGNTRPTSQTARPGQSLGFTAAHFREACQCTPRKHPCIVVVEVSRPQHHRPPLPERQAAREKALHHVAGYRDTLKFTTVGRVGSQAQMLRNVLEWPDV